MSSLLEHYRGAKEEDEVNAYLLTNIAIVNPIVSSAAKSVERSRGV